MDINKENFDLVCSLGGNCMVSHNLLERGMRDCSLPFDWLCFKDEKTLYSLAECFKNNFKNFMLKENMRYIPPEEMSNECHNNKAAYQDMKTGYYFLNHFDKKFETDNEFKKVQAKIKRRIERLIRLIKKSNRILFVLSNGFEVSEDSILHLSKTLKELYPNKEIFIKSIQFNSKDEIKKFENVEIVRYKRVSNLYDYIKTNYEWNFLDNIEINRKLIKKEINREYGVKLLRFLKLKKGFAFEILPFLNSMISSKLYIFGVRLNLSIGKMKNE